MSIATKPKSEVETVITSVQERMPSDDILRRAWAVYYQHRAEIETDENIGKFVAVEVQTGDYEVADRSPDVLLQLWKRHADPICGLIRIGYKQAYKRAGGIMERLPR